MTTLFEPWFFLVWIGVLGLLLGSFANVVILRLPSGRSIVRPGSCCSHCQTPIRWRDNIPILSWFLLRGRARCCGKPVSYRYPLVEFIMAFCFTLTAYFTGPSWTLVEHLILIFGLVTASFIDFDHYILPDVFTLGGLVLGLFGALLNPERSFWEAVAGVVMGGGFLWLVAWAYLVLRKQDGMGGGDIKLLAWIGAVLGWQAIPFVVIVSSLIGTLVGLTVALRRKSGMQTVIPFGPYLALGAALHIWGGAVLGQWYISFFLPALVTTGP